jgi:hypothetical protein
MDSKVERHISGEVNGRHRRVGRWVSPGIMTFDGKRSLIKMRLGIKESLIFRLLMSRSVLRIGL